MKIKKTLVSIRVPPHYEAAGNYYVIPEKEASLNLVKFMLDIRGYGLVHKEGFITLKIAIKYTRT